VARFSRLAPGLTLCLAVSVVAQTPQASGQRPCKGDTVDREGVATASKSRAFLAGLKAAIEAGDKEEVSKMMHYPLRLNTAAGNFQIRTRAEFLSRYNQIIDSEVIATIQDEMSSRCLFSNYQGFMIGDGQLWFQEISPGEFRVNTINLSSKFKPKPSNKKAE